MTPIRMPLGVLEILYVICMVGVVVLVVFGLYWIIRSAVRAGMRDAARDAEQAREAERRK